MPLRWHADTDPRILWFVATGDPPSLEQIVAAIAQVPSADHPAWAGLVINDTRAFPAPTAEYMRQIMPTFGKAARGAGIERYAILAGETTMYGMGRMASFLADPGIAVEAFTDEAAAREWLLRGE